MNKTKQFTLHIMVPEPGLEPLKVVLPKDGTNGLVIGEDWEVKQIIKLLSVYIETGKHDGEIKSYHEQLGIHWITASAAEKLAVELGYNATARTIRWAAAHKFIEGSEKHGRDWNFPKNKFLYWLGHRPKPGRKPS